MSLLPHQCRNPQCELCDEWQYMPNNTELCQCGSELQRLVIVHRIEPSKTGVIKTSKDGIPIRYEFMCERARLAVADNLDDASKHPKRYTDDHEATSCYHCLLASGYELKGTLMVKAQTEDELFVN